MNTYLAQLEIFSFYNGDSWLKYLPSSSSSNGIVKSIGFFPVSSLEDCALVDAIAKVEAFFRRIKVFSLCARKL